MKGDRVNVLVVGVVIVLLVGLVLFEYGGSYWFVIANDVPLVDEFDLLLSPVSNPPPTDIPECKQNSRPPPPYNPGRTVPGDDTGNENPPQEGDEHDLPGEEPPSQLLDCSSSTCSHFPQTPPETIEEISNLLGKRCIPAEEQGASCETPWPPPSTECIRCVEEGGQCVEKLGEFRSYMGDCWIWNLECVLNEEEEICEPRHEQTDPGYLVTDHEDCHRCWVWKSYDEWEIECRPEKTTKRIVDYVPPKGICKFIPEQIIPGRDGYEIDNSECFHLPDGSCEGTCWVVKRTAASDCEETEPFFPLSCRRPGEYDEGIFGSPYG